MSYDNDDANVLKPSLLGKKKRNKKNISGGFLRQEDTNVGSEWFIIVTTNTTEIEHLLFW